ncbi:MAG: YggS family pyridoxal phosphate-dependent enzyme [Acidobacteriota bacterium]
MSPDGASAAQLAARRAAIHARIADACRRADRDAGAVTLVAVTKTHTTARLAALHALGERVFGESRLQEAEPKQDALQAQLPADAPIDWHFIAPLQSNKVRAIAQRFSTVHAIDRDKIVGRLDAAARAAARRVDGFLQVNVGEEPSKYGYAPATFVDHVAARHAALARASDDPASPGLQLVGLMALPPYEDDPAAARRWFARLRALRDDLRGRWGDGWPGWLSMGTSHDFEIAIEEGATHVRVGTDLLGPRETA